MTCTFSCADQWKVDHLRQRIHAAAEAYLGLSEECERQVRGRQLGPPAGETAAHSD